MKFKETIKKIIHPVRTEKSEKEKTLWLSVIVISLIIFLVWIIKVVYNIKNL